MLVLLEKVKASKTIPWDYDIFQIVENNEDVGRLVYRYGSDELLKYSGHIGYHIEEEFRGNNYAYKAVLELFNLKHLDEVIITCDLDNIASQKTIEKLCVIEKRKAEEIDDPEYRDGLWIYRVKKS